MTTSVTQRNKKVVTQPLTKESHTSIHKKVVMQPLTKESHSNIHATSHKRKPTNYTPGPLTHHNKWKGKSHINISKVLYFA